MVSRRWLGGLALAGLALWLARAARAETAAEYQAAPAKPPAIPAAQAPSPSASPARRAPFAGYAAESARTVTRLPQEERDARVFLRAASQAARFELEASRLARSKAQSTAVLAYADELLQYQDSAGIELQRMLQARGMAPPMLENAQRKALNRLARMTGPRFDREYLELVGAAQQREDVLFYEKAVTGVGDPAVRAWIERQLPTLRSQHAASERAGTALSTRTSQRVE